jgi:tetratricopeptide (TPR) repeat protein
MIQAGKFAEAYLKAAQEGLATGEDPDLWHRLLARAYLRMARIANATQALDSAEVYYRQAYNIAPEEHLVLREYADYCLKIGRIEEADRLLIRAEDIYTSQKQSQLSWARLRLTQARVQQDMGYHEKALEYAQKALDLFVRLGMKMEIYDSEKLLKQLQDCPETQ